jgi:hypothetical protein
MAVTRARFRCRTPPKRAAAAGSWTRTPPSTGRNRDKHTKPGKNQQEINQISGEHRKNRDKFGIFTSVIMEGRHADEEIEIERV